LAAFFHRRQLDAGAVEFAAARDIEISRYIHPMRLTTFGLTGCIAFFLTIAVSAADSPANAGRAALEKWFAAAAKVKTVQADFEQLRKLRSVRNPLRKPGKMWMDKSGDLFRWQVGDPPELLAVRTKGGGMTVLDAKKSLARVWSKDALEAEEKQGRGQGFAMLNSMQNASIADFDRDFDLAAAEQDAANPALWRFDWKFKDGKISMSVLRLAVTANVSNGALHEFTLHMRDGSTMGTVIRSYKLNGALPAEVFKVDTSGYKIEAIQGKS
jgi:outer membrane lipoprotein-sorting protein